MSADACLYGELRDWPDKDRLAVILRGAGLRISVGKYSIRLDDLSHFVFEEYGGDLGSPQIDADADTPEILAREAECVSRALATAGIIHRFEIYHDRNELVHYMHHGWPRADNG